ncbi:MAG: MFS transporter [Acidimicrobiia bacterium]
MSRQETPHDIPTGSIPGLVVVSSGLVLAALPIFMVGGLAVQIRGELGFNEAALGAAVTIAFALGAVTAPLGGRIADRIGPHHSVVIGSVASAVAMIGISMWSQTWPQLVASLGLAGLAIALFDPGLAILVRRSIPTDRQGFAFGLKEASVPAATLVAGLAVPAIALTVGWRWAFAFGAIPVAVIAFALPRVRLSPVDPGPPAERRRIDRSMRPAVLLAATAAGLGTFAASGVGVFLTESAVAMGSSPGAAGLLLATGSIAGIVTRLATGMAADRRGGEQLGVISGMLGIGAAAIALGATGESVLLVVGTVGAFAGAWGWTGIYFLSLVRASPSTPGAVAGLGNAGLGVGNALGPIFFGLAAQSISFRAAWACAAVAAAIGAILMRYAHKRLLTARAG